MSESVAFVSLRSNLNNKFLQYKVEKGKHQSFLQCSGEEKLNPLSKFAIEPSQSNTPGSYLVHLRSCYNNKYLVRNASDGEWIVVAANEKEEDQSKWCCTLFKPIMLQFGKGDTKKKTVVRFQHVQSSEYACLSKADATTSIDKASEDFSNTYAGLSKKAAPDGDFSDTYTVMYWTPKDVLPQHVAFKGDNNKYATNQSTTMVQFLATDISDTGVTNEVVKYEDQMKIRNVSMGCFWQAYPMDHVLAYDESITCPLSSFEAIKLDTYVIALKSLDNNIFCGRNTGGNYPDCMYCMYDSINNYCRLNIEEAVVYRRIVDVVYDFDNAKIYDVTDVKVISRTYRNWGSVTETYTLEVDQDYERNSTWNSTVSAKFGVKTDFKAGIPLLAKGEIETSLEFNGEYQWGETDSETLTIKDTLPVTVPAGKQRTARAVAKRGKCDIHFTYVQIDQLYNGDIVTQKLEDGIYSGSNYYDFVFEAGPELPITTTDPQDA